jgi:argininosuccinate lyase
MFTQRITRRIGASIVARKPWGGRFDAETDRRVEGFTESISFDNRLFKQDIQGSIAHARMLVKVGLLEDHECQQIVRTLLEIQARIESGQFPFESEREDVHMHIEAALVEALGDVGRKLHTARSRNDQTATDLRLWTREALDRIDTLLVRLQSAFVGAADRHRGVIVPGYTHMQRAQPVLAAHYFLAYVEKLERDHLRLADCRRRLNVLPLGTAALAGTSLAIDRDFVARELGFDDVTANSLDASSDRDFVLESLFVLTLIAEHLAGWAGEWILWSTQEFGFLDLPDAICTGSSIMPQKKNPDVLELIRGRAARIVGALTTLLVLVKGLPLAYNRDLQEDKEPLFDAVDTIEACLSLAAVVVDGAALRAGKIAERLDEGFLDATTVMEFLIAQGIPQRTAHEVIGQLVGLCERRGLKRLADLSDADLAEAHPKLGTQARSHLGVANAINAFRSYGSTAPAEVNKQLERWKSRLIRAASGRTPMENSNAL